MKLSEFLAAVETTKMQARTRDAARLVLTDGLRVADAAREMEMKRQQVEEAVRRIEVAFRKLRGIPNDWEAVTICVPTEVAKELRERERLELRKAGLSVD